MYLIVNYKSWWRYPESFRNFRDAFDVYEQLQGDDNIIEYYNSDYRRTIVWSKGMIN